MLFRENSQRNPESRLLGAPSTLKRPTYFDNIQAYAQERGLGWLLHADGDDTNDISKYDGMASDKFQNLKTTGDDATAEDKTKATKWINDSSILAGIPRRSCQRSPLGRNIVK